MTLNQVLRASLLALGLATLAPMPAWAAGFDAPPYFFVIAWLWLLLVLGMPAMGLGYALAGFLTLRASIGCVVVLALVPTAIAWIARGIDVVAALAPIQLMMLLLLGPLFVWGWWIGHRDTTRQMARRQAVYENGK
jgi:hypothetical protein